MKSGRIIVFVLVALVLIAGAAYVAFMKGLNIVREGLVANYPTVKNVVTGSLIEVDSVAEYTAIRSENSELFNALAAYAKGDTLQITVPYYGRYGVSLAVRNYRVFRDGETIEVWLPSSTLNYCELKFEQMKLNGAFYAGDNYAAAKRELYNFLLPKLRKHKANQKAAKASAVKSLMFYFVPYKYNLKVYIENEQQPIPDLPGVNKDVDEYLKEQFGNEEKK